MNYRKLAAVLSAYNVVWLALLAALVAVLLATFVAAPAHAQMYSLEPLSWAVPVAKRPLELQNAKDMVTKDGQNLRLRAEVWVVVDPCPKKKAGGPCFVRKQTQGRLLLGPVWHDVPVANMQIERVWLLQKGGVWTTDKVNLAVDGYFEFEQGPPWPGQTMVDVIVKVRGSPDLLQSRYRTMYQKARAEQAR